MAPNPSPRPRPRPTPGPVARTTDPTFRPQPTSRLKPLRPVEADPEGWTRPPGPPFYRRGGFWLLVGAVVVAGIVATVVIVLVRKVADDNASRTHTVVYRITGDAPADIAFYSGDGLGAPRSTQLANQRLPWTRSLVVKGSFDGFTLTATFHDLAHQGRLTCTISVDGKQVTSDEATGTAFVGCDGSGVRGG